MLLGPDQSYGVQFQTADRRWLLDLHVREDRRIVRRIDVNHER